MRQYLLQSHQAPKTTLNILKILDIFQISRGQGYLCVKKAQNKCLYVARELNQLHDSELFYYLYFVSYILALKSTI